MRSVGGDRVEGGATRVGHDRPPRLADPIRPACPATDGCDRLIWRSPVRLSTGSYGNRTAVGMVIHRIQEFVHSEQPVRPLQPTRDRLAAPPCRSSGPAPLSPPPARTTPHSAP